MDWGFKFCLMQEVFHKYCSLGDQIPGLFLFVFVSYIMKWSKPWTFDDDNGGHSYLSLLQFDSLDTSVSSTSSHQCLLGWFQNLIPVPQQKDRLCKKLLIFYFSSRCWLSGVFNTLIVGIDTCILATDSKNASVCLLYFRNKQWSTPTVPQKATIYILVGRMCTILYNSMQRVSCKP